MKKEDAIKYLQQLYPNGGHCWLDEQRIEAIGMAVKALQEEPVSEDLEKEMDNYLPTVFSKDMDGGEPRFTTWFKALRKTAIYFAKWQKEQMMANAIDGKVIANGMGNPILHLWDKGKHLIDKKVKVILIKED